MANFKGKRMVEEDLIKKLEELEPGGGSYEAGSGIDIEDNTISIDDTVVATKTDLADYELKSEAFSGDYDDLTNKPDLSIYAQSANLATVATTGDYDDLINKPTIPAAVSGTNDGTNWTSLTIGQDTYDIPAGGGSSYTFTNGLTESSGTVSWDLNDRIKAGTGSYSIKLGAARNNTGVSGDYCLTNSTQPCAGKYSVSLGYSTYTGSGSNQSYGSFAIGRNASSRGQAGCGALGNYTTARGRGQLVIGTYNIEDTTAGEFTNDLGKYLFIIGNGTSSNRSNALTVDTTGILECTNIPAVSGTDGTYQLTATTSSGATTYSWAAGGSGSGKYLHQIQIAFNASGSQLFFYTYYVSNSATAYTNVIDFLTDAGYTITGLSDTMSRYLSTSASGSQYAIAYRQGTGAGIYLSSLSINSSGVIVPGNWSNQSNTPGILDVVVAL